MSPSLHEPDTPFESAQQWDAFDDTQMIDGYSRAALETSRAVQDSAMGRTTRAGAGAAEVSRDPTPLDSNRLGFLPLAEWDEYNSYEEDTPSRLRYSIEWKVAVNNRVVAKDTEQDLVLVPAAY